CPIVISGAAIVPITSDYSAIERTRATGILYVGGEAHDLSIVLVPSIEDHIAVIAVLECLNRRLLGCDPLCSGLPTDWSSGRGYLDSVAIDIQNRRGSTSCH